jgi:hypothetical protein
MNLENFKQAYLKTISESDDSDLKNYIRSIVEEVISEANEPRDDFEKNVKPLLNPDWGTEPGIFDKRQNMMYKPGPDVEKGFDKKFVDALEKHVQKYGDYQVWNFYGKENGEMPDWWDSKAKKIKPEFIGK